MDKRKKLLIINRAQFGYHIDSFNYCKHLRGDFDITYLGWDYAKPYVALESVDVHYIRRGRNKIIRYINFILKCIQYCNHPQDIVFIDYFPLCSLVKFLANKNNYIVDIRTGYLINNPIFLFLLNSILSLEVKTFKNITIISLSLANKLGLNGKEVKIIPLGADIISTKFKSFDELNLLYVGTFHLRNIEQTVKGFAKYYRENNHEGNMNYIIIGSGYNQEEERITALIMKEQLDDVVTLLGPLYHDDLKPYFDTQNIGISFVPITPYFDCQPSTKTFEYLLSGMAVLATKTHEHALTINENNGVLISDTADSFYEGLKEIKNSRDTYNSERIRTTSKQYMWENIIKVELKEYLLRIQ